MVVRSLSIFRGRLKYRQTQLLEQIILERLRSGVCSNIHISDHAANLFPQLQQALRAFALLADHGGLIHEQAVVFHQAAVNCRGTFNVFHDPAMPRQKGVEPFIEAPIQAQGVIAVGAGIAHRFGIVAVQLVEKSAAGHVLKGRQLVAQQLRHQLFQAAVGQAAEFKAVLQRHLGRGNGVIAGRLNDNAQRIEKHGLEGQIVGHLRKRRIRPECIPKKRNHLIGIGIAAVEMLQRDIKSAALGHGERDSYNAGPVRIQRRPRIVPVLQQGRGFKIKSHHSRVLKIIFNGGQIGFTSVIHKNLHGRAGAASPPKSVSSAAA